MKTAPHDRSADPDAPAPKQVWFNGQLLPADQAAVSVYDHGLLYGDGVFEGIRAYRGRVLKMRTHLRRLSDGARAIMLTIPYSIDDLCVAIHSALKANAIRDGYIRLCVTRGAGSLGLNPFVCKRPNVFIIADSITLYPPELYESGLEIITASTMRNHPAALDPRIKSLNYLNNILAKIEAINAGCLEALMLNHQGYVAECTGDNVFAVRRRGEAGAELHTPPPQSGALEGITRAIVMDLARDAGYAVRQDNMTRHDLFTADEVFLTGTAAEVIPVTKIDGRPIGDGHPGPITRRLIGDFRALIAEAPED